MVRTTIRDFLLLLSGRHRKVRGPRALIAGAALLALAACAPDGKDDEPEDRVDVPDEFQSLPFLQPDWSAKRDDAPRGKFVEIERPKLTGVDTEGMEEKLARYVADDDVDDEEFETEADPNEALKFEFFHIESGRSFQYEVRRADLASASLAVSPDKIERRVGGRPATDDELERESEENKSWSNKTDNRTRRAVADGYSDTHSIYQSFADYGGCSATVLYADSSRMVAATAAHCIYVSGGSYSTSRIRPRRDGGTSPTWGTWTAYGFGFYPQFLDNDCEDNWKTKCIKHDIALVLASPNSGATPPSGIGWGYRPKSFLDDHSKYRRGYPGCGFGHSPNPCTANNLYGDGSMSVGSFKNKRDGWHRRCRFSSDVNPGDSGSGLYYYRSGNPYLFAVASAEDLCAENCSKSRPNHARLHTKEWFDFINSVVP